MVGTTGIEPVTPSMSTRCSPAELRAHFTFKKILLARTAVIAKIGSLAKQNILTDNRFINSDNTK